MLTQEQKEYILDNYKSRSGFAMAEHLGVSKGVIYRFMIANGIERGQCGDGRYKKGNKAHNKGIKGYWPTMSADAIERMKKTQFKKGNVPHNTKEDGAITLRNQDSYKYTEPWIRLSKGEWMQLSRYTYIKHHGSIPEGYNIIHLDGDPNNNDISNLLAVTKGAVGAYNHNGMKTDDPEFNKVYLLNQTLKDEIRSKDG